MQKYILQINLKEFKITELQTNRIIYILYKYLSNSLNYTDQNACLN